MLQQYIEQAFLSVAIRQIESITSEGGCLLRFGTLSCLNKKGSMVESQIFRCFPVLSFLTMDNEGANKALGVYTGRGCAMPCRFCEKPYRNLHQPLYTLRYRNMYTLHKLLRSGSRRWFAAAKQIRRNLSEEDKTAISAVKNKSLHFFTSTLMDYYARHPVLDENCYQKIPPDEMHTVLGGCLKDWIFWTAVILEQVSLRDKKFRNNMSQLDNKLKNFNTRNIPETLQRFTFHQAST